MKLNEAKLVLKNAGYIVNENSRDVSNMDEIQFFADWLNTYEKECPVEFKEGDLNFGESKGELQKFWDKNPKMMYKVFPSPELDDSDDDNAIDDFFNNNSTIELVQTMYKIKTNYEERQKALMYYNMVEALGHL